MPGFSPRNDQPRSRLLSLVGNGVGAAFIVLMLVAGYRWIMPAGPAVSTDFTSFYAAGVLVDSGHPELAYDRAAHYAAEQRVTRPGVEYKFFYYPPVYLLLCGLFALFPYSWAFLGFELAGLIFYLWVMWTIVNERNLVVLLPVLLFPAVPPTLGLGQNAFLTAALFGTATLLVDRRPASAGCLFGALCYKPHFGLLVPLALAAGRRWRCFAAATVSVVTLYLLSLILFGLRTWRSFFAAVAAASATYTTGVVKFGNFITPFGAVRLAGGSEALAYVAQAAATLTAAALVAYVWHRGLLQSIRAAMLAAATLIAVPPIFYYDLLLGTVAAAWLIRDPAGGNLPAWEQVVMVGFFLALWLWRSLAAWQVPIGSIAAVMLVILAAVHVRRCNAIASRPALG